MLVTWDGNSTYTSLVGGVSTNNVEAASTADDSDTFAQAWPVGDRTLVYSSASLVSTIQSWLNNPTSNFGWMFTGSGPAVGGADIMSSENGTTAERPSLSITYTVNAPPTLSATSNNPTFTESGTYNLQAPAVNPFSSTSIGGLSTGQNISSLTFSVGGLQDGSNETIWVDGTQVSIGANSSGSTSTNGMGYSVTYASGTATVVLSKAGGVSGTTMQGIVNGLQYQNTNVDNPTAGNRVFTLTQIKDNGGTVNGGQDTTTLNLVSTVSVVATNDAPVFTSDGGGASASVSVAETLTAVTTASAFDPEGASVSYSVSGADAALFDINASTGVLSFKVAPDFESPQDADGNNVYQVVVSASDGSVSRNQNLSVTVLDMPTTLVVDTTADTNDTGLGGSFNVEQLNASKGADGKVSLREAIIAANNTAGHLQHHGGNRCIRRIHDHVELDAADHLGRDLPQRRHADRLHHAAPDRARWQWWLGQWLDLELDGRWQHRPRLRHPGLRGGRHPHRPGL